MDSLRFLIPVRQTTLHSGIGGSFQAVVMALFLRQLYLERGATRGPTNAERNLIPFVDASRALTRSVATLAEWTNATFNQAAKALTES